jgi:hypothetical protein
VARWLAVALPRILHATRRGGAYLVFLDEAGCPRTPSVRRTLAKRGQTPVWAACFTAGCGGRAATGEVYGKVTYNSKPVTAGTVKFFPEDGGEPVGSAIGVDGTYRATGVPVGRSKVAIETLHFKQLTPPPPGIAKQLGGPRTKYVPIPGKYERPDTSGLAVEVELGKKPFDIELR